VTPLEFELDLHVGAGANLDRLGPRLRTPQLGEALGSGVEASDDRYHPVLSGRQAG